MKLPALGANKQEIVASETAVFNRFRLDSFIFRPVFRVVAVLHRDFFQRSAAIEQYVTLTVEQRESAAATEQVTLVRRGDKIRTMLAVAQPGDRVRLARYIGQSFGQGDEAILGLYLYR